MRCRTFGTLYYHTKSVLSPIHNPLFLSLLFFQCSTKTNYHNTKKITSNCNTKTAKFLPRSLSLRPLQINLTTSHNDSMQLNDNAAGLSNFYQKYNKSRSVKTLSKKPFQQKLIMHQHRVFSLVQKQIIW